MIRLKPLAAAAGLALTGAAALLAQAASLPGNVTTPELSEAAQRGQAVFGEKCASCHGADLGGTNSGPPLVHDYYRPGHHADMAFVMAVRYGSRAHHWRFGDMPPVAGVSDDQLVDVITFVREVQQANGIE